ncbi:MAG: T9SS C-terminal target domain-containing protein, partial [Bacteroidia bacterium]
NDTALNGGMPYYKFSTNGLAAQTNDQSIAKKALDLVNVVPNPYYAFSYYEDQGNPLDTRIKITNLPKVCEINIYTLDGVLVRRIKRDDDSKTYFEWDLKNDSKVPIVSGIYLIHIKATELGEERVLKWFGVMRPADYDSF